MLKIPMNVSSQSFDIAIGIFSDENHGLGGVKKFLYHTFDSYWTKCFGVQSVLS
jgi:hypothetical protein